MDRREDGGSEREAEEADDVGWGCEEGVGEEGVGEEGEYEDGEDEGWVNEEGEDKERV